MILDIVPAGYGNANLLLGRVSVERDVEPSSDLLHTADEVAALLRVSARWLADQCRAERIEHIHVARRRPFTRKQVMALIETSTVRPDASVRMNTARAEDHRKLDATRQRVLRLLARTPRRRCP